MFEFCLEEELCLSNTWIKREGKRKMTFRMGENETEIDCVDKERTPLVYTKCDGNPWGVSTCLSDSCYRLEENKESSERHVLREERYVCKMM